MLPRQQPPGPLLRLAALQGGVVTTEQVVGHGLSRHALARLIREGQWQRLARSAYFTASGTAPPWESWSWAGVLLGGPEARLGAAPSAYLGRLLNAAPEPISVLIPARRVVRVTGPWQFQREAPGVRPSRSIGSLPRLPMEEAVLDLCDRASEGEVVTLLTRGVQKRLTTPKRLLAALEGRSRQGNRKLIGDLLGEVAGGVDSALELRFVRDVERPHGLPKGRRQRSRFGLPYVSDVGYDEYALILELDGRDGHQAEGRFRDMNRDNLFALHEALTLRYGWFDVTEHACRMAGQIGFVLGGRGWPGPLRRCGRCAGVPDEELPFV